MKRLLSILIAIALMLSMSVTAFAEETGNLSITRGDETYYYDYIEEAFEDARDGDVIKVEREYMEAEEWLYYENDGTVKSVTLNLNGKEIHTPAGYSFTEDHGMLDIYGCNVTFTDTVGGGVIHALVSLDDGNAVVKGGTYLGFFPLGEVTIEGGTFLGLPQDIVDDMLAEGWPPTATFIGTKGLLLTTYERVFLTEDEAREALDAIIADGYIADKPYEITPYEMEGETRYSAGFAAGTSIVKTDSNTTTVTYEVAPTYTVTIPETVTIGADGTEKTVSAEDVVVNKGQYVSVTLAADNNFTVKTAEGAELAYTVTANGENIAAGGEILAVNPADGKTGTATITFDIDESIIQYAGTYTGSATFTIAVKNAPKTIINFTIDGTEYQAEEGMTWAQWVESAYNNGGFYSVNESVYWGEGFWFILCNYGKTPIDDDYYVNAADVIQANTDYVRVELGEG